MTASLRATISEPLRLGRKIDGDCMDFLMGYITQIVSTAGVIVLFGWLIAMLRRAFCAVAGRGGPKILLATGIIGTPIHELSHALMCVLFGHRIDEIKLFRPNADDGTLGYVSHSYNKKNIYHQIGNFFIGVAPVVIGGGAILLLLLLLLPDSFDTVMLEMSYMQGANLTELPIGEFFSFLWVSVCAIFAPENFESWHGWVFIVLALMIASHTEMSSSDIKSGAKGFLFIAILLLLVDAMLYFIFPDAFLTLNDATASFALIFSAFLSLSVIFLLAMLIIALIFKGIGMIFSR